MPILVCSTIKLNGSNEYFGHKSKDMLYNRPTAGSLGYTAVQLNVGSMTNSGVEIDLNYQIMANKRPQLECRHG